MSDVRHELVEARVAESSPVVTEDPLTRKATTPRGWIRANLFSSAANTVTTVVFALLAAAVAWRLARFVLVTARWEIVRVNLASFMVGNFPRADLWRPALAVALISLVSGATLATGLQVSTWRERRDVLRRAMPLIAFVTVVLSLTQTIGPALVVLASVAAFALGRQIGRRLPARARRSSSLLVVVGLLLGYLVIARFGGVGWNAWGGLMLNVFLAIAGITLSFPFGVLLALGRRSTLPAIRLVSTVYIELIRGVPLITLLLMGQTMLGFFLPPGTERPGQVTRALVAFVLFTAAYVAEVVRGGLQGVPAGQSEAARAIGLSPVRTALLIVLPQALRNVIPALVGQFISLTKDTALVATIGVLDLLRVARVVTQQPQFAGQGLQAETLLFAGFCFWTICFTMSRASQRLERRLGVGTR